MEGLTTWRRQTAAWLIAHGGEVALAAAVAVGLVLALLALRRVLLALARRDDPTGWRAIVGKVVARTRTYFLVALAARLVVGFAQAPPLIADTVKFLFVVAAVFQAAHWARALILGLIERRAGLADIQGETIGNAMGIIRLLVTVILFAVALIVVLDNLGVNVTGLVAGLGVGGIAIGLAAQGIFSDLFAALSILFDQPFKRGDTIRFGDVTGTVEAIGLKSTRLRALTGEQVIVGNTELLKKELRNLARLERRRITTVFKIANSAPVDQVERLPAMLAPLVAGVPSAEYVRAFVRGFAPGALEVELHYDLDATSFDDAVAAQHAVNIAILRALGEHKIALANI